jgi:hypothetical protein
MWAGRVSARADEADPHTTGNALALVDGHALEVRVERSHPVLVGDDYEPPVAAA